MSRIALPSARRRYLLRRGLMAHYGESVAYQNSVEGSLRPLWFQVAARCDLKDGTSYSALLDLQDDLCFAETPDDGLNAYLLLIDRVVTEIMGIRKGGAPVGWALEAVQLDTASRNPVGRGYRPSFGEWVSTKEITLTVELGAGGHGLSPTTWLADRAAAHAELDRMLDTGEAELRDEYDDQDAIGNVAKLEGEIAHLPHLLGYLVVPSNARRKLDPAERKALSRLAALIGIDLPSPPRARRRP